MNVMNGFAFNSYKDRLQAMALHWSEQGESTARHYNLADRVIRIVVPKDERSEALLHALAHLEIRDHSVESYDFHFFWLDSRLTGLELTPPPFEASDYSGYAAQAFCELDEGLFYHRLGQGYAVVLDPDRRNGFFITDDALSFSIHEKSSPFINLIHWMMEVDGWGLAHAACIGSRGVGSLIVGHSGSGKSTTAMSALLTDRLSYLCDDKCLVRLDPTPRAFGLYNSVKLNHDVVDRFPFFTSMIVGTDVHLEKEKSLAFLYPEMKERFVSELSLMSILMPRVAFNDRPVISAASPVEIFKVLGTSTSIWFSNTGPRNYQFLAELVRKLPCHYLDLALDPIANVDAIHDHILSLSPVAE